MLYFVEFITAVIEHHHCCEMMSVYANCIYVEERVFGYVFVGALNRAFVCLSVIYMLMRNGPISFVHRVMFANAGIAHAIQYS